MTWKIYLELFHTNDLILISSSESAGQTLLRCDNCNWLSVSFDLKRTSGGEPTLPISLQWPPHHAHKPTVHPLSVTAVSDGIKIKTAVFLPSVLIYLSTWSLFDWGRRKATVALGSMNWVNLKRAILFVFAQHEKNMKWTLKIELKICLHFLKSELTYCMYVQNAMDVILQNTEILTSNSVVKDFTAKPDYKL